MESDCDFSLIWAGSVVAAGPPILREAVERIVASFVESVDDENEILEAAVGEGEEKDEYSLRNEANADNVEGSA